MKFGSSSLLRYSLFVIYLYSTIINCQQDQREEQFEQFAQNLADFFPTESFEFNLSTTQQQTLLFWPQPETQRIRGLFYITSPENGGLFVGCESAGEMKKTFYNKKIGVFNVDYPGVGDMKLILKSQIHNLSIYISYEFVLKKAMQKPKETTNTTEEQNQLAEVEQKFEKVRKTMVGQQIILDGIVKSQLADEKRLLDQINSKTFKIIIETAVVIISGFASLWMLRKELMKNGYQPVI